MKKGVWLVIVVVLVCGVLGYVKFKPKPGSQMESQMESAPTEVDSLGDEITMISADSLIAEQFSAINLKLDSLSRKEIELREKEVELSKREIDVHRMAKKVDSILVSSNSKFAKAFESMEPTRVSSIMDSLGDDEVMKLLLAMGNRSMAQILELMPPERVARIVSKISEIEKESSHLSRIAKETKE